jgi:hypothetical protein
MSQHEAEATIMDEPPPENEQEHGIHNQQAKVRPHISLPMQTTKTSEVGATTSSAKKRRVQLAQVKLGPAEWIAAVGEGAA